MAELDDLTLKIKKINEPTNKNNTIKPVVANMSKDDLTTLMKNVKDHLDKMDNIRIRLKNNTIKCEDAKLEFNTAITKFDKNEISMLTIDNTLIFTKEDQNKLTTLELKLTNIDCDKDDIIDIHSQYYNILYHIWSYVMYQSGIF